MHSTIIGRNEKLKWFQSWAPKAIQTVKTRNKLMNVPVANATSIEIHINVSVQSVHIQLCQKSFFEKKKHQFLQN